MLQKETSIRVLLFWKKWAHPDISTTDLLWYAHHAFGDEAMFLFTEWCLFSVRDDEQQRYVKEALSLSDEEIMPHSVFQAQNAWRCLMVGRLSELSLLEVLAQNELSRIAGLVEKGKEKGRLS